MKNEELKNLFEDAWYNGIKFHQVTGRYLTNSDLDLVRSKFQNIFEIEEAGKSVEERPIYKFQLGTGKIKILAWSQMHGNESTTTKAIFDLLNALVLRTDDKIILSILENCSLFIIPILNPDGAEAYTRVNANSIDLNRDLQDLSQPESRVLMKLYNEIKPDYCLNLHDQRTIFSAGNFKNPATLSFLTPSKDEERSIDEYRRQSMSLIAGMAQDLSSELENNIGRYDDAFNINCAGDTFQNLSTPTILFEAGHYPNDYEREETRKFVFKALLSCLYQIAADRNNEANYEAYFKIPENQKLFKDVIIRKALINGNLLDIAIQFKESLKNGKIEFIPIVDKIEPEISNFGLREIEAQENEIELPDRTEITENVIVNKIILKNEELQVKYGYLSN